MSKRYFCKEEPFCARVGVRMLVRGRLWILLSFYAMVHSVGRSVCSFWEPLKTSVFRGNFENAML